MFISIINVNLFRRNIQITMIPQSYNYVLLKTFFRNVNNDIMEMLIMAYACKTASARKIVGVLPYLPYSKQSKMKKRGSIVSKLVATLIGQAGMSISIDSILNYFYLSNL